MFKERYISKLIFVIPLLFIILTAVIITFTHIQQSKNKFEKDSLIIKETFLKEEQKRLDAVLASINSYIKFKKATSLNILKNQIKSKVDFADNLLQELYSNAKDNKTVSSIQVNLLASLASLKSKDNGKYFIFGYKNKQNAFEKFPSYDRNFLAQFNELISNKNEGFIVHSESIEVNLEIKELSKLTYIKNFKKLNLVIGYSIFIDDFEKGTKKEVIKRLELMQIDDVSQIFTLDENQRILQYTNKNDLIGHAFKNSEYSVSLINHLNEYSKKAKADLTKNQFEYFWKELDSNNYKLYIFNYIKSWDWIVGINLNVNNINKRISKMIGVQNEEQNKILVESIKTAIFFILIASIISYFLSLKINQIITTYKNRIESQKNALRNINATLEVKVEEKTEQLEVLNENLKKKFKEEVRKNRKKDQILYTQSKMASMGEMIGNIAHQWRQPLSTISTIASGNILKMDFGKIKEDEIHKDFVKIVDTTKHLSNTIEDFRNFFMEDKKLETFNLIDVLEKNLSLVGASMQNNYITIVKNFNSVEYLGLQNELLQAILNILHNARDILITKDEDKRIIVIDIFENDSGANIVIKDSGGGIPADIKNEIFKSHFTTKSQDLGTGIGLYMTLQIIKNNMNGSIIVSNEEFVYDDIIYNGAAFKITLPLKNI